MRILQILPELNVGGVETGTIDLAKYFVSHGHHAAVVSNGGILVEELEKLGGRHYRLPVHKKSFWHILKAIKAVRQIIIDEDIDIVHARSRVPAWIAYLACRQTKATFVTTCHGYYSRHFFSRVMGWGKVVIVPSEVIGRHMIEDFGVATQSIRFIPRSVDSDKFNVPHEDKTGKSRFVVSIIGRITPLKGHTYFLKAMAKVIRSMPYVRIWIIGSVPRGKEAYQHELEMLVQKLGLMDSVDFLGSRQDVPQLLAQTDVVVLATITQEAFGRVILEAQAAGVPVVATKVGGVVEIIDHEKTGLLVLPKDIDAMANAVLRLLKDKTLATKIVEHAKERLASHFTLDNMAQRTINAYEEALEIKKILVIKFSSLGDVVLTTASLKALREKFPKAHLSCLVGQESVKILQRCPHLDELIVFDSEHRGWGGVLRLGYRLLRQQFDMVIDFQNNRKSHLLSFLSFPRHSYGYNNRKWGFLLTNPVVNPNHDLPPVQHQFQILSLLGISYPPQADLELWLSEKDNQYIEDLLNAEWLTNTTNIVGVNISASAQWVTKNWPIEYIAKLCDLLATQNIRVVVTGMERDRPALRDLLNLTKSKPADFVGKTDILQLAALIKRCRVYVTPDSAPLHIAAAMRTPVVTFFGPTSSIRHLPPIAHYRVIERKLICAPCYSKECRIKTHACMRDISPEEVAQHIQELMGVGS